MYPSGTVVALISAADKDSGENGQVKCEIGGDLPFRLDRESVFKYDVIITCSDAESPPLSFNKTILVEVSDVNDNSPRFTQSSYNAYIMENNIIGNSFFQVTAVDTDVNQNALLTYSIA